MIVKYSNVDSANRCLVGVMEMLCSLIYSISLYSIIYMCWCISTSITVPHGTNALRRAWMAWGVPSSNGSATWPASSVVSNMKRQQISSFFYTFSCKVLFKRGLLWPSITLQFGPSTFKHLIKDASFLLLPDVKTWWKINWKWWFTKMLQ